MPSNWGKQAMLYGFHDLQQIFRQSQKLPTAARIREILRANNIPFGQDPRGRPFTTTDAVNYALGIKSIPPVMEQPVPEFEA